MITKQRIPTDAKIKLVSPSVSHGRKSFSISIRVKGKWTKFKDERLDALNEQVLAGKILPAKAKAQANLILQSLYRERDAHKKLIAGQADNEIVALRYFEERYNNPRAAISDSTRENARQEFTILCATLGKVSILTGTKSDFERAIDQSELSISRKNAITTRLNSLLSYLKRDLRIKKIPEPNSEVTHIPENDFQRVLVVGNHSFPALTRT